MQKETFASTVRVAAIAAVALLAAAVVADLPDHMLDRIALAATAPAH